MNPPNVLWLSVSPYLKGFDQRLLSRLTKSATVRRWEYQQTADEGCCIQSVVDMLHEYVSDRTQTERCLETSFGNTAAKIHLAGHGMSGIVALLYAQQHPEQIASLTLLSVAAQPAINWQAHYYALRQMLPCSREMILAQMTRLLFGQQTAHLTKALSQLLARDLDSNLTLHSLAHHTQIVPSQLSMPLLVCNGTCDVVVGSQEDSRWQNWRSPSNSDNSSKSPFQHWYCPQGNHFFHFYHAAATAAAMSRHWQQTMPQTSSMPLLNCSAGRPYIALAT